MTLKRRLLLLTVVIVLLSAFFCTRTVQAYHSRIPLIGNLFYGPAVASDPEAASPMYKGIQPTPDDPNGVYYKDRVVVLMYHGIAPKPTDSSVLPVSKLERQLQLMKNNNFHWITMDQYRDFILHGAAVPDNAVLLTFDDGYESFYQYAYPLLREYGAPAASFLIVDTVGNPNRHGVPKLNWDQVAEMRKGGISFYSHTNDLHSYASTDSSGKHRIPALSGRIYLKDKGRLETEKEYEARVRADLKRANEVLEQKLGEPNHVLAFPYGAFSEPVLKISKELGIDVTLTVREGLDKPGDRNGFRVNAGGTANDPDLQLALMKQAPKRIGNGHFDRAPEWKREALLALAALLVVSAIWVYSALRLVVRRRQGSKGLFISGH